MNRNLITQSLARELVPVLFLAIFAAQSCGQTPGAELEEGPYAQQRTAAPADTPEYLVTGIALGQLVKAHFANMRTVTEGVAGQWGRVRTLFDEESRRQVKITVAVYGSASQAEGAALELLSSVSAVPRAGSKSGGAIGNRSWYLESPNGSGTVVFVYRNSLCQLFSSDYDIAEASARSITEDLMHGRNGVRLGTEVYVPEITDVEIALRLTAGEETSMRLKAADRRQRDLAFFVSASRGTVSETERSDERIYVPVSTGTVELRIHAINDMNVVSQVYIKTIEVEE